MGGAEVDELGAGVGQQVPDDDQDRAADGDDRLVLAAAAGQASVALTEEGVGAGGADGGLAQGAGQVPVALAGSVLALLLAGRLPHADDIINGIRFELRVRKTEQWPARTVIWGVYLRDHYQCRYCGARLILTPVMRLIARIYPAQ